MSGSASAGGCDSPRRLTRGAESLTRCPCDNEGRSASAIASRPERGRSTPEGTICVWSLLSWQSASASSTRPCPRERLLECVSRGAQQALGRPLLERRCSDLPITGLGGRCLRWSRIVGLPKPSLSAVGVRPCDLARYVRYADDWDWLRACRLGSTSPGGASCYSSGSC